MISPLQNLQTLLTIEHQLLANLLQNSAPMPEQMQQGTGQAGTADNSPSPGLGPMALRPPSPQSGEGKKETSLVDDSADSTAQTIKETGDSQPVTQNDKAPSLKEQIVSLSQTLVQQGHLPSSTLNQPIPVIIPQMLACLGKLHREEKKKKQKKKKKREDEDSEDKRDTPVDALLKQIFRLDGSGLTSRG